MKINLKNIVIYVVGIFIMAFGVTIMKRSLFGMGAWDAIISNLATLVKIELGFASFFVNLILLLFVVIYRKSLKYTKVIIPIVINMLFLLFWDSFIFKEVFFNEMWLRITMLTVSLIILPLSIALMIVSTLPKMIYDEITIILMELFKTKKFGIVRLGFEIAAVIIAMLIGLINGDLFMQIGIGTIAITLTLGYLINKYLDFFRRIGIEVSYS